MNIFKPFEKIPAKLITNISIIFLALVLTYLTTFRYIFHNDPATRKVWSILFIIILIIYFILFKSLAIFFKNKSYYKDFIITSFLPIVLLFLSIVSFFLKSSTNYKQLVNIGENHSNFFVSTAYLFNMKYITYLIIFSIIVLSLFQIIYFLKIKKFPLKQVFKNIGFSLSVIIFLVIIFFMIEKLFEIIFAFWAVMHGGGMFGP